MPEENELNENVTSSEAESIETDSSVDTSTEGDGHEYVEVSNADEYWDAFDLTAYVTDSDDEESNKSDDAEGEEPAFPSEDEVVDADPADPGDLELETVEETDEIDEQREQELLDLDLDRPAPLSRRKAERVVKGIIEPLRDPNTPISDVLTALSDFHPTRTQQLAEAIVNESVQTYPNEWLKSLTGLDVTVDQIKAWAATGGSQPANTAPVQNNGNEVNELSKELTELYGEAWKDPSQDSNLLEADVPVVKALRAQLVQNEAYAALQKELEDTRSQLGEIKPQIEQIKTAQEAEFEQAMLNAYQSEVETYRSKVESASIPKILEAKGLVAKESDPPEVKAVKELVASRFKPIEGYGSDFDIFLEKQFSGKEPMHKAMTRVSQYLAEATKLDAESRRTTGHESSVLKTKANALKEQASLEQDALTVWTRKAAAEFLDTSAVRPVVELLQQNMDLQRRLQSTGRPEIVGQTAAIGDGGWKAQMKEAKEQGVNPFDLDISGILGGR